MVRVAVTIISFLTLIFFPSSLVFAQGMMGSSSSSVNSATIQSQQQEEQEGKKFLDDLNNKTVSCSQLKDADFEKIGEYFMGRAIGDTSRHIAMNEMMKSMMSEQGEEQVHVAWGKRGSNCDTSSQVVGFMPTMGGGGANSMMGFGNVMGWDSFGFVFLTWVFWIVALVDLILLGILLWEKIKKEK